MCFGSIFFAPEGKGIMQKFHGVGERTSQLSKHTEAHALAQKPAAGFERWLLVTAHLDFHLSKPCLLWLTRRSRRGIDFSGKDGCGTLHSCEKKPGSCGQRRFSKIWRGIGVTLRWQSGMKGLLWKKYILCFREAAFFNFNLIFC